MKWPGIKKAVGGVLYTLDPPKDERILYSDLGKVDKFPKMRIRWSCLNHHAHRFKFMANLCVKIFAKEQEKTDERDTNST